MPKTGVVESVLTQDSDRFGPLIAKFNHGSLNCPTNLKSTNLVVSNSQGISGKDERNFELSLKTDKLTYSSEVPSAQNSKTIPTRKMYIAFRNKHTRQVRLVESNVISLGPQITARSTTNKLLCDPEQDTPNADSWLKARKELVNKFGQTKGKRYYDQADKMKVNEDAYAHKMSDAVANANFDGVSLEEVASTIELLPPCNREAKSRDGVYDISNLLSSKEIQALEKAYATLMENYADRDQLNSAIANRDISTLAGFLIRKGLNSAKGNQALCIILYMEGLLKFSQLKEVQFKGGSLSCLPSFLPSFIRRKIYTQFSDDGKLTPLSRDKAICYAIILALLAADYRFDYKDLLTSVKVPAPKLKMLVLSTGASVVTDKVMDVTEVVLKLPLSTFDANRIVKKKKKNK